MKGAPLGNHPSLTKGGFPAPHLARRHRSRHGASPPSVGTCRQAPTGLRPTKRLRQSAQLETVRAHRSGSSRASRRPAGPEHVGSTPLHYKRRRLEQATLYDPVQQNAASFIAHIEGSTGAELPHFITDRVDALLECSILAQGLLRLRWGAERRPGTVPADSPVPRKGLAHTLRKACLQGTPRGSVARQLLCADIDALSLRAAMRIGPHDRKRPEQLGRRIMRPAPSDEWVQINAAGHVGRKLKPMWRDGPRTW